MSDSLNSPPARPSLLLRLARHFGLARAPADDAENPARLQAAVSALVQAQAENQTSLRGLHETVEKLEKQLARLGKEQFKANALAETQQKNFKTTLEQLREAETYRERELAQLREKLAAARDEGRLDVIKSVLPALDGLGEAIASGERLLKSKRQILNAEFQTPNLTFAQRLNAAARILFKSAGGEETPDEMLPPKAVSAWLQGLTFVQDRLLEVLASEGVHPIETEGESFDPHLHVAIETMPVSDGVEPGAIVRELRRGYDVDENVLRYAEVVVARASDEEKT
jgi:molecular chaperone GrpE (heat shock protein)